LRACSVLAYWLILALLPFMLVHILFSLAFCFATLVDSFKLDLKTCFQNLDRRIEMLTAFSFQYRYENIYILLKYCNTYH